MPSESEQGSCIGSMVSINCGKLGTYQGHVEKIDTLMNTLTLTHAFHNGLRCEQDEVNLSSTTIVDIEIIKSSTEAKEIKERKATPSKMTKEIDDVTKPTCTSPVKIIKAASKARTGFQAIPEQVTPGTSQVSSSQAKGGCRRKLSPPDSPSKFAEIGAGAVGPRPRMSNNSTKDATHIDGTENTYSSGNSSNKLHSRGLYTGLECQSNFPHRGSSPRKMERGRRGTNAKNSECFSAPIDSFLHDFDFESNLKLFNKKAVFQEIENGFPDLSLESAPREAKFRHDENVLQPSESNSGDQPEMRQQIEVPETKSQLYCTDTGLVVPSISLELRDKISQAAAKAGLSLERQLEAFGHAATEIIIQLIGGSHRIQPKNDHQMPVVVVLCGAHDQGAVGVCVARILACHNVQVTVLMPNIGNIPEHVTKEVELYRMSGGMLIHNVKRLPSTIDLIISALDSPHHPTLSLQSWYQAILNWNITSDIRAPILALDPPPQGPGLQAKWSLCKVLPLFQSSTKCGSLYLCDLSIPVAIFTQVGVKYKSPFGPKFTIPLHPHQ